jgi:outer membrane protein OmpA-like peptidoglycan-associated protein
MDRSRSKGLSLQSDETPEPKRRTPMVLVGLLVLVALAALGFLGYEASQRARRLEAEVARLAAETQESNLRAREALERAQLAESSARAAAEGRQAAEAKTTAAQGEAEVARLDATTARDDAARARAEAEQVRKHAEAEMSRLEDALGKIAETHRTALGVVMNLGSEYLKFEFDKAELRAEDRELLSRVAGILLSSQDYTVSVNGHTDDVGSDAYNQKLSERRAQGRAGLPGEGGSAGRGPERHGTRQGPAAHPACGRYGPRQEPTRGARHREHPRPVRPTRVLSAHHRLTSRFFPSSPYSTYAPPRGPST